MRGEDSAPKEKLNWHCMKALSTHMLTKTFCRRSCCRLRERFQDEKEGWELQQDKASCHTAKSTQRWLEQHGVDVVEGWPTKGDDFPPSRTSGLFSTTDLRAKSLQQRKE